MAAFRGGGGKEGGGCGRVAAAGDREEERGREVAGEGSLQASCCRGAAAARRSVSSIKRDAGPGVRDAAEAKSRAELAPKGREAAWREVLADSQVLIGFRCR